MSKPRIVVVEDEAIVALDLENRLNLLGYEVAGCAASGLEAIELVKKEQPDLILMDIMLAGDMDGIQTAAHIQKFSDIPTIFLTAYTDSTTLTRATEFAPAGYIIKPYEDRELRVTIDIALARKTAITKDSDYKAWFHAAMDSRRAMILVTDSNGLLIKANAIAKDFFNLRTDAQLPLEEALAGLGISYSRIQDKAFFAKQDEKDLIKAVGTVVTVEGDKGKLGELFTIRIEKNHEDNYQYEDKNTQSKGGKE